MLSPLEFASAKNTSYSHFTLEPSPMEFKSFIHSLDSSATNARSVFGDVSNDMPFRPITKTVEITSIDDSIAPLSRSRSDVTLHLHRVADKHGFDPTPRETRHDTGACTHEWKAHNSSFRSEAISSSSGSNGTTPGHRPAWNFSVPKRLPPHMLQTVERQPVFGWLREDTGSRSCDLIPLTPPGLGTHCHKPAATFGLHSPEELSEGRPQPSEIRRGLLGAPAATSFIPTVGGYNGTTETLPALGPVIPSVTVGPFYDDAFLEALANWTSEWLYKMIIQPHIQQGFKFQYHGKPNQTSTWVARRLCPVLRQMQNPVQIVIHALWFVGTLASDDTYKDEHGSFFSVPFFRHLRAHGTWTAEDFMFRTFVVCAIIGDKSLNDVTFSTKSWKQLTSIPRATLDAMEKVVLTLLEWDVVMTHVQWQESILYFRTSIKKSDPIGLMARLLDELATTSFPDGPDIVGGSSPVVQLPLEIIAPQPIRAFTQWQLYIPQQWCPEDDPVVNQKPRTVGIAPGADHSTPLKNCTTAKDLLDMILGSSGAPDFVHLGRSAGTSFYGSFGAVGPHLAQTAKHASVFPNSYWIPAQG